MSLAIRPMRRGEESAVAEMVRGIAQHVGSATVPKLTGEGLAEAADLVDVVVADDGTRLAGACLGLMTYSTWRGQRGLYVVDLFVHPHARGQNVGSTLLRNLAQRFAALGAAFIKLEMDESNVAAEGFYARLGFTKKTEDRLHILEQDKFTSFISVGDKT